MSNLKILGAQRIKALTLMLEEKEKQKINEVRKQLPTAKEAEQIVDEEFGATEIRKQIRIAEQKLLELSKQLESKTGQTKTISNGYSYNSATWSSYSKRKSEIQKGNLESQIKEIQKEFADKKNLLWLCETLEEAKAIVGI